MLRLSQKIILKFIDMFSCIVRITIFVYEQGTGHPCT